MSGEILKIEAGEKSVELKVSALRMTFNSFLSGLAWGVGSVLGATVVVSLLFYFFGLLDTAPLIGDYISKILENINK
ncbi:MAG TPA: DUF5665 domain-containing protein [Candidatus Nanoarchaeia archaeon]|nr:hypothetical protein [uncultured archaeon]